MATNRIHDEKDTIYFVTFTCTEWLNLFEITNSYDYFNKWFEYLNTQQASLLGYVIMPNHFHGLIYVPEECKRNINKLVANGKRFLAYEIVSRLKEQSEKKVLGRLAIKRSEKDKAKGSSHKVFIPSFDAKACFDRKMVETKLDYIHHNPVNGKWRLVAEWPDYPYSSAAFYMTGQAHPYLKHYLDFI